jgi:hypothetical protein
MSKTSRSLAALLFLALAAPAPGAGPDAPASVASPAGPPVTGRPPARPVEPLWRQLSDPQREALSPLAGQWDAFDATRKKRWIEIASHYKDLSPEGKQKMHDRMPDLARLTPQERTTARDNFRKAYSLPPEKRKEITQQFQELPDESKHALDAKSAAPPGQPPRRPAFVTRAGKPAAGDGAAVASPTAVAGAPR